MVFDFSAQGISQKFLYGRQDEILLAFFDQDLTQLDQACKWRAVGQGA